MQSLRSLIPSVLENLRTPEKTLRSELVDRWPALVGSKVAQHTKPSLLPQGILIVWVDQSSLAFELSQRFKASILKRAQALWGEEKVREIRFKTGQIR